MRPRACSPPAAEESGDGDGDGDGDGGRSGGQPAPCASASPLVDEAAWLVSVCADCPYF